MESKKSEKKRGRKTKESISDSILTNMASCQATYDDSDNVITVKHKITEMERETFPSACLRMSSRVFFGILC